MMRKMLVICLLLLGLLTLYGCDLMADPDDDVPGIGDTVTVENLSLTIISLKWGEETLFGESSQGQRWLIIEVALANVSSVTETITASLMFELRDDLSNVLDPDLFASTERPIDGALSSGATRMGEIVFSVDETSVAWTLVFFPKPFQPIEVFLPLSIDDIT